MSLWFYEKAGERVGPVSEQDVISLYKDSIINTNTLVWNKSFKNEWRSLGKSGIDLPEIEWIEDDPPPLPQKRRHELTAYDVFIRFRGRIDRANFITFYMMLLLFSGIALLGIFGSLSNSAGDDPGQYIFVGIGICVIILSVYASFALVAKRLHDMGYSALHIVWIQVMNLVCGSVSGTLFRSNPGIGAAVLLVPAVIGLWVVCTPGQTDENKYGPISKGIFD